MNKDFYKYVDRNSPKELRLMVAKGLIPAMPEDMLEMLYILTSDNDEEVRREAKETIKNFPDSIFNTFLSLSDANSDVLNYLAKNNIDREDILEKIVLNKNVSADTFLYLAPIVSERIGNIIADNYYILSNAPKIIDALIDNPNLSIAIKERLSYLIEDNLPISKEDVIEEEGLDLIEKEINIPKQLIEDKEICEKEYDNLYKKIQNMSVSEKIKLALLGNKEARGILVKDSNKLVSTAVLRNQRVTDSEIVMIAQSRNICEDAIRILANNKEWTKNYQVKLALVTNPKTPSQISLKFLNIINYKDLSIISKSRNIPSLIATTAKRLLIAKER